PNEEVAITICSNQQTSDNELVYEHKIVTNFNMLNEIRHTHILSETIRQNLSSKAKYNQGFGYAKKAIDLALQLGQENELNKLLLGWIKEKEMEIHNTQFEHETLNISNPYYTCTKGVPKKHLKSVLENISNTTINKDYNDTSNNNI
ncbi:16362_t:CDS:1, partial [Racocetra fulgida]